MHNFFLNIFLFLSLFFASETINISLDPISHNTFYLDSVHPVYQPDLIGEYIIDGDIGSARSVFLLKDLYPIINDSTRTNSSLLYKQGDVGYRDISIYVKTKVDSTGVLKFTGNGLSYPVKYSQYSSSNILQNYLIHFFKKYSHSIFSFYTSTWFYYR